MAVSDLIIRGGMDLKLCFINSNGKAEKCTNTDIHGVVDRTNFAHFGEIKV